MVVADWWGGVGRDVVWVNWVGDGVVERQLGENDVLIARCGEWMI